MGAATRETRDAGTLQPVRAFGPAVWGWGLAGGLAAWVAGFLLLPWWAALLLWWWPSMLFGAIIAFAAIELARLLARAVGGDRATADP
jgi:uncharacterized BrkB/YihY/UPF0761 family membrane protein